MGLLYIALIVLNFNFNIFNFWLILKFNFNFDIINFYIFNSFGGFILFILCFNFVSNFNFNILILILIIFKFSFIPFEKLNFILLKSFDFSPFVNFILKLKLLFCFSLLLILILLNFIITLFGFISTTFKNFTFIINAFYSKILIL